MTALTARINSPAHDLAFLRGRPGGQARPQGRRGPGTGR